MANDLKVLNFITNEMLRQTKNNLQFLRNVSGQDFAGRFTENPKVGETIRVRKTTQVEVRTGETFTQKDFLQRSVDMTVGTTVGVDLGFTSRELNMSFEALASDIIPPAAQKLSNYLDTLYLKAASDATANSVGVPGTIPTSLKTYNQARALMSWKSAPQNDQTLLITPDMQVEAVDAGKSFFTPSVQDGQYETGMIIGSHYGAKVYECQNCPTHTVGPLGGNPLVDGANQDGNVINVKGFTAAAAARLKKGDSITFALVYDYNVLAGQSTGALRQFALASDVASAADGTAILTLTEKLVLTGPYQNVTNAPADSAVILIFKSATAYASKLSPRGFRFHKDSFLFGTLSQPSPTKAVEFCKEVSDPQTKIKMRYIRDWDTRNNVQIDRIDVVPVWGVAFPEWACNIESGPTT